MRRRQCCRSRAQGLCSAGVLLRGRQDGSAACQTCGDLAAAGAGTLRQPLDVALFIEPCGVGDAASGAGEGGCQIAGSPSVSYQPIRGALSGVNLPRSVTALKGRVRTGASPSRVSVCMHR